MKEVTINNCSVATDINWESPVHPVISRPHSDGANRSVQHGGVAGGAVRMEPTPDGVGSFLAAADHVPRALSLPSHWPTTTLLLHGEKNAFHGPVPQLHAVLGGRGGTPQIRGWMVPS